MRKTRADVCATHRRERRCPTRVGLPFAAVVLPTAVLTLCALFAFIMFATPAVPAANPSGNSLPRDVSSASCGGSGSAPVETAGTHDESASGSGVSAHAAQQHSPEDDPAVYEPGAVLVTLSDGVTLQDALSSLSVVPELASATVAEVVDGLFKVELPASLSVKDATALMTELDCIDAAQPNYRYRSATSVRTLFPSAASASSAASATAVRMAASSPATSSSQQAVATASSSTATSLKGLAIAPLGSSLGLQSVVSDPYYGDQWYLASINARKAWDIAVDSGISTCAVAVIDAGFYTAHEDLVGNVAVAYDATKNRTVPISSNLDSRQVDHGTHCAGIIAAAADNSLGIAGVTYNACQVLSLRVEDDNNCIYTTYVAQAYSYLVAKKDAYNIRVVNMSLGSPTATAVNRLTDKVLYDSIQKGRNAGIVTVAAACNNSDATPPYHAFPSDFDNAVSVIALDEDNSNADGVALASYSNYNVSSQRAKNISAPGTGILSLLGERNWDWGTDYYGTLYGTMDGTSMAAPIVAGVMGLMLAVNPKLTADEAISKLYSSAKDLTKSRGTSKGWDRATGFGEVDLAAAASPKQPYLSGSAKVTVGKPKTFSVKVAGKKQLASGWKWTSGNTNIATVSSSGVVKGKKAGRVIITASKGSYKVRQVVLVRVPAKSFTAKFSKSLVYTGKARTLAPRVSFAGKSLKAGRDYTVKYSKNVSVGKAVVTITGVAPYYTGSVKVNFKITKAPLSTAKIKLSATKLRYTGKARKPSVTVYDIGRNKNVKLKRGVDYTVKCKAVKRGKGIVKICAKSACANFKGSATKTFRVI